RRDPRDGATDRVGEILGAPGLEVTIAEGGLHDLAEPRPGGGAHHSDRAAIVDAGEALDDPGSGDVGETAPHHVDVDHHVDRLARDRGLAHEVAAPHEPQLLAAEEREGYRALRFDRGAGDLE